MGGLRSGGIQNVIFGEKNCKTHYRGEGLLIFTTSQISTKLSNWSKLHLIIKF